MPPDNSAVLLSEGICTEVLQEGSGSELRALNSPDKHLAGPFDDFMIPRTLKQERSQLGRL